MFEGEKEGYKRDILDAARKKMIEGNEVQEEKRGKHAGIRLSKRSDVPPYLYKGGTSERSKEIPVDDLQEVRI